jgi:branched-chain amino acid aminotransferase
MTTFHQHPVTPLHEAERRARMADPAFGEVFTDHLASVRWTSDAGWHDAELRPFGDIALSPATGGLHYGQIVFEGLKAYRQHDGWIAVFRLAAHATRLRASARRLLLPEPPEALVTDAVTALVRADRDWVPDDPDSSLYLRPLLFGTEPNLALRPARAARLLVMAFATRSIFDNGPRPLRVWISDTDTRAAAGGTGAAKAAGNYASALPAQQRAAAEGCDQVVWLDAAERRWVEELGAMNLFFVTGTGRSARLTTPPLTGTILPGITRDTLLVLARELGYQVSEEPITVDQWRDGCTRGDITEVFACGTAARISPVGEVRSVAGGWQVGDGEPGPVTRTLLSTLTALHHGTHPDPHGWLHPIR